MVFLYFRYGVIATEVGYTGGSVANATYHNHEGHAEAVRIEFDPSQTSYEALLRFFFRMHDPTTRKTRSGEAMPLHRVWSLRNFRFREFPADALHLPQRFTL